MRWLLLARHLESVKNRHDRFAQPADTDLLTPEGASSAASFATDVADFIGFLRAESVAVYCSSAPRAVETAGGLCRVLGVPPTIMDELRSIVVPQTAGRSSAELLALDPAAARQLNLYRAGLFDSYAMAHVGPVTPGFEAAVAGAVRRICRSTADAGVVVGHRSTITAALLGVARRCGHYPAAFFGFVPIDFGACALVKIHRTVPTAIAFANLPHELLDTHGRAMMDAVA